MGIKLVRIRDQWPDRSNWHTNRCQNSCLTKLQAARVVHTDKNGLSTMKHGSKMETNTWKRKVPHLRSSQSGGPAAPPVPQLQGRALQQEWLWPRPAASSSSRSSSQGHKPLPQRAPVVCVSTRLCDPLPVRSYEPANSQGVIKEEISAKGKLFRQFFSYQAAFGGEPARRWAVAFLGFLPPSSNAHPASGRNRGHVLSLLGRKKGTTEKAG